MDDESRPRRRQLDARREQTPRPLDAAGLQALALHYAARYATTSLKLRRYLARKLKERPWEGAEAADPEALVQKLVDLGYVDDQAWAAARSREMAARGLGQRRIVQALAAAGVRVAERAEDAEGAEDAEAPETGYAAAVRFARRRRLGPFAREGAAVDAAVQRRAMAAMLRAGHDFDVARRVLAARTQAEAEALAKV